MGKPSKQAAPIPPDITPDLARILRPQAAYRWMLPQLAAITPQYIEMTLRGALAGNHMQQWELFSLMVDSWPRLIKNLMELVNGVGNLQRTFTAYQEEDQPATPSAEEKKLLVSFACRSMAPEAAKDENDFGGTIRDILEAWSKGVSALEIDWQLLDHPKLGQVWGPRCTFWVHPTCYSFSMEGYLGLRTDAKGQLSPGLVSTPSYQPMPSHVAPFPRNKFIISIRKATSGTPLGGALLRSLAWWWCASNFSADWLLNLAQTFGLPFRWANYAPNAPQATIDAICNMLQNMGSNAWAAFPAGTTLELKEASNKGEHSPQGDMLDRADKNCDLLVLGQTLTSDAGRSGKGGGSLALGKVHEGVKADIVTAAANFVVDTVRSQLFAAVLELNYGEATEVPGLNLESEKEEDLQQKSTMVATLVQAGCAALIPQHWINKTFEIPEPQPGEKTLGDLQPAANAAPEKPPGGGLGGGGNNPDADSSEATGKRAEAILAKVARIAAIEDDAEFAAALSVLAAEGDELEGHWVTVDGHRILIKNRIADEISKSLGRDDRSAEATIHGDAGSEKQALRDELGKIEEAGERRGASRAEQIREQGDAVKRYAARNGAVTLERARIIGEGGEHVVEGAGDRVLKHTKGFGSVVDAAPGEKPDLKPATPMEYLRRTDAQNKLFGDDSQLEGASVSMDRQHVGLAASQRTLEGSASEEDVRKTMSAAGYRPVAASAFQTDHLAGKAWFHPESGVLVSDTKPQNFITGADGKTVPFDTIPQHFPEGHPLREHFLNHLE